MVNVRLLGHRSFGICCGLMFLVGFLLISTTQLLPQLAQSLLGYDATTAGLTLGVGGIGDPAADAGLGHRDRAADPAEMADPDGGARHRLVDADRASGLSLDISFWSISPARVSQVIWLPFLFIPLSAVSYVGLPPKRNNEASALINLMRNLGGSVGVSFVTTMLQERTQFHHARLAEHITAYNGLAGPRRLPRSMRWCKRRPRS